MATTPGVAPARVQTPVIAEIFQQDCFVARQKIFSFAPKFTFYDEAGSVLAFLRKKVFTWKDDIRLFTDPTQSFELLRIRGRQIIDFGASFDVTDSLSGEKAGVLKRRGWKSLLRAEWDILDSNEIEVGKILEDSPFLAILRRLFGRWIPQGYSFEHHGNLVGTAQRTWNLFVPALRVDFSLDTARVLDRRLIVAAVVLLMTVERVEESN
jgi:uncharacterized protein YxjI